MSTTTKQPVLKLERPRSKVKGSIWLNDGEKGPYYTVNISRSYKDKKEEWKTTSTFSLLDVSDVISIAEEAIRWIDSQQTTIQQAD